MNTLEGLKLLGESLARDAAELAKHPEGEDALNDWISNFDFSGEFGTRWKDISDETLAHAMVLNSCSFGTYAADCGYSNLVGRLYNESQYSTYVWFDGEWINFDDLTDEQLGIEPQPFPES